MERIPDEWIVQVRLFKFKMGGGLSFAEAMVNPTPRILKIVIIRMKQEEIIITLLSFKKMAGPIRTRFLEGRVKRKGGFCQEITQLYDMLYRPKWGFDCSQKRLPIKLKNRHGRSQDIVF